MSEHEIRIAIAEACGWKLVADRWTNAKSMWGFEIHPGVMVLPDYCCDLNAMHEVEQTLEGDLRWDYLEHLSGVTYATDIEEREPRMLESEWRSMCATARQRAEAFLRVIGKWPTPAAPEKTAHRTPTPHANS